MKRVSTILLVAYFLWFVLLTFIPAAPGGMWPIFTPLIVISLLYLIHEDRRSWRIIGALLVILAIIVSMVDFREGSKTRDKNWKVHFEALEKRAEQAVPDYRRQCAPQSEP